jgi:hypothetical protein
MRLTNSTGLRPTQSDHFPSAGAERSAQNEYAEAKTPIHNPMVAGSCTYVRVMKGNTGMMMVEPAVFRNAMTKMSHRDFVVALVGAAVCSKVVLL